jgi:hypothetical protein
MDSHGVAEHGHVNFFIDKTKFTSDRQFLTPREILADYAKEDATQTTLVLVKGKDKEKQEQLDTPIDVKGAHFTVLHNGPTPVS